MCFSVFTYYTSLWHEVCSLSFAIQLVKLTLPAHPIIDMHVILSMVLYQRLRKSIITPMIHANNKCRTLLLSYWSVNTEPADVDLGYCLCYGVNCHKNACKKEILLWPVFHLQKVLKFCVSAFGPLSKFFPLFVLTIYLMASVQVRTRRVCSFKRRWKQTRTSQLFLCPCF